MLLIPIFLIIILVVSAVMKPLSSEYFEIAKKYKFIRNALRYDIKKDLLHIIMSLLCIADVQDRFTKHI